jgi:hypothetical protein
MVRLESASRVELPASPAEAVAPKPAPAPIPEPVASVEPLAPVTPISSVTEVTAVEPPAPAPATPKAALIMDPFYIPGDGYSALADAMDAGHSA